MVSPRQSSDEDAREPEFTRAIGLPQATAMVVGIIIGASIFLQPSEVAQYLPSVPGIFLAWLAAGVVALSGALVCAELASTFPNNGGVYVFLREALGRPLAISIVGVMHAQRPRRTWRAAASEFLLGVLLFSGLLYVLTFAGPNWKWLGAVVPIGGVSFIVGELVLAIGACKK